MSGDVHIKQIPDQLTLTVRRRATMTSVGEVMGEAFGAVMAQAEASGAQFAGPPFCMYPGEMGEEFDLMLCMPVMPGAAAGSGVDLEEIPGGTAASVMHVGPYSGVGAEYARLQEWMAASGRHPAGAPREVYLNDPSQVPESELLTEIDWPVA